ncbi:unnamed protein product, partial [Cuscuta campestris]
MEAYVDDLLIKSKQAADHPKHLEKCFSIMRKHNLRLNPKKCAFGVQGGKFLGYIMSKKGIEVNPDKLKVIQDMEPPTNLREVQRLAGRIAALGRFLARSAERSLPFFTILKGGGNFQWTAECQEAFEHLKEYLSSPPVLSKPLAGDVLFLYLGVAHLAVSSVLLREEGVQKPVYYTSRALRGPETRYTPLEKCVLAVVVTVKRLTPYFQAHPVRIMTDQPLGAVLRDPSSSGRVIKWAMVLSQYDISYQPRSGKKGQVIADFMVECTARGKPEEDGTGQERKRELWEVHSDGSCTKDGSGGGAVLTSPEGFKAYHSFKF